MTDTRTPVDGPPQPRTYPGLLDHITATSLDEDYAHAAARRRARTPGEGDDGRHTWSRLHTWAFGALAVVGLMLTVAGVETARNATSAETSRETLVAQVKDRRTELADARALVAELRRDIDSLQDDFLSTSASGRELRALLDDLGVASGASAVTGPGLRIVVDDASGAVSNKERVLDTDLQRLVNGLWAAGAEAVAINGHRLTNLTAIRTAGDAITVGKSLSRPYVVDAIGDPEQLPARFVESDGGIWWFNLESVYNIRFDVSAEDNITVPAAPGLRLRLAEVAEDVRPEVDG